MGIYGNIWVFNLYVNKLFGVICGHIHKAEMKTVEDILYANDGDWVESMTALVENIDGKLEIIEWAKTKGRLAPVESAK